MPYKLNHDRRRHIPRQRHRVVSSAAYDAVLRQRGSLTVWFTDAAIEDWRAEPRTTPCGQPWYFPLAILTALTLKAVFHLALRQTEGLIGSVVGLLGLTLAVPASGCLRSTAPGRDGPGDRGQAAVAHGRPSGDRGGGRCPCAQPHVGAWTPELRPHHLTTDGVGATAPALRVCATCWLRRLSRVFPAGTARAEVEERKNARQRRGEEGGRAQAGVVEDLADELVNGRGLGIVLRQHGTDGAVLGTAD